MSKDDRFVIWGAIAGALVGLLYALDWGYGWYSKISSDPVAHFSKMSNGEIAFAIIAYMVGGVILGMVVAAIRLVKNIRADE